VDTQAERPDLTGVPLLRAAIRALPESRRRNITTMSQASWFDEAVREESSSRAARAADEFQIGPVLKQNSSKLDEHMREAADFISNSRDFQVKVLDALAQIAFALGSV